MKVSLTQSILTLHSAKILRFSSLGCHWAMLCNPGHVIDKYWLSSGNFLCPSDGDDALGGWLERYFTENSALIRKYQNITNPITWLIIWLIMCQDSRKNWGREDAIFISKVWIMLSIPISSLFKEWPSSDTADPVLKSMIYWKANK